MLIYLILSTKHFPAVRITIRSIDIRRLKLFCGLLKMVFESTVDIRDKWFLDYDTNTLPGIENVKNVKMQLKQHIQKTTRHLIKSKIRNNAFDYIFNVTLAMGIPIQPIIFDSERKIMFAKWFCLAFFVVKTLTMTIALTHVYTMLPDFATRIAYYIFNFFSYVSMITLVMKRKLIYSATKNVTNLSKKMCPKKFVGSKTIVIELCTWILSSISIIVVITLFFFYQEWDHFKKVLHVPILGYYSNSTTYTWMVVFGVVSSHTTSIITSILSAILVYSAFLSVSDLLDTFSKMLRRQMVTTYDSGFVVKNITLFREISSSAKDVDRALNACCLFILGTVISSFFSTISVMFSPSPSFQTPVARCYVGLTLLSGLYIFFILTISGDKVVSGCHHLKAAIMETSEKMANYSSDPSVMRQFILLSDNIKDTNLAVTGCEMFTINKSLILTVGGMVITYSFLLIQINKD